MSRAIHLTRMHALNTAPTYESLGILPVPPGVTFHGPLRLRIGTEWRDFRDLHGPTTLSGADVERINACECTARRCLTVENLTPFRSLAALGSGELLVHTSYPNEATLALLRQVQSLPSPPEFWHFGDTDPSGFHILADLRKRT
jgi:DNA topoisomerase VI subunit A